MAKRKAPVNDIIYELDNDDIVISSDDESKEPKIARSELESDMEIVVNNNENKEDCSDTILVDCTNIEADPSKIQKVIENGGKTSTDDDTVDNSDSKHGDLNLTRVNSNNDMVIVKTKEYNTTLYDEDIVVDSPASNVDLGVVGCENRLPLVTLRFKDTRLANTYKKTVKEFMLRLIKLHNEENLVESDNDTDIELDIWPEDLVEDEVNFKPVEEPQDDLFFIDTAPCNPTHSDIPKYSQVTSLISNIPENSTSPPPTPRRGLSCFNCDGAHPLRDCVLPRDYGKIAEKRKNLGSRVGRYHVEDEQKYGHLVPGRISGHLRNALNLKRNELPLHIYRMRIFGYPPGWLEEARISHSGITLFDSTGHATLDPNEEEGEVSEPGSKDKFDIKKILDFPGFNVQASSRYLEEAHLYGLPPVSQRDSKMLMLQTLAPNAMMAYKRKKLTFFPSAARNPLEGQGEMELDSGDEIPEFPLVPPLPDEEPPEIPPPPPPPSLPPPPESEAVKSPPEVIIDELDDTDMEIIEVMKVNKIPVPEEDLIVIDVDEDDSQASDICISPSIDDLEQKKMILIDTLDGNDTSDVECATITPEVVIDIDSYTSEAKEEKEGPEDFFTAYSDKNLTQAELSPAPDKNANNDDLKKSDIVENIDQPESTSPHNEDVVNKLELPDYNEDGNKKIIASIKSNEEETIELDTIETKQDSVHQKHLIVEESKTIENCSSSSQDHNETAKPVISVDNDFQDKELTRTPNSKPGKVKDTSYGTPVMNIASPYTKLPSDSKFAKDICDIITYENLPNSIGKYKKISSLLKKVKNEVDRIHDS